MPGSVIVGGARTPIGKLSGALEAFQAVDLGGLAIKAALAKSGVSGDQVDYVIMGHVIQAGAGQMTAGRPRSRVASRWTCPQSRSTRCAYRGSTL
jgi:acetyl-CoA C-acetyltransferase